MNEAASLNFEYAVIFEFSKKFVSETQINSVYDVEDIITKLGGKIKYVSATEYIESKFVNILNYNNFEISLLKGLDKDFKRLLLIQSLGHYVLHGISGRNPCFISSASKSEASKEGLWFALSVLIPDDIFLNIHEQFNTQYLANIFRVPSFAIEAKKKIIKKIYLNKEII